MAAEENCIRIYVDKENTDEGNTRKHLDISNDNPQTKLRPIRATRLKTMDINSQLPPQTQQGLRRQPLGVIGSNNPLSLKNTHQNKLDGASNKGTKTTLTVQGNKVQALRQKGTSDENDKENAAVSKNSKQVTNSKDLFSKEPADDLTCSPMSLEPSESDKDDTDEKELDNEEDESESYDSRELPRFEMMEYAADIYSHLCSLEIQLGIKPYYMRRQPDISYNMRSILVDWMVEVIDEYKLQPETLFLSVMYVDKFLSSMSVLRNKLQLVGTTSMFIASKYEEIYPPDIKEFVYITDDTYTKRQVLQMEQLMLKVLSFDLALPTAYSFLQFIAKMVSLDENVHHLALYLCELTLLEGDPFLQFVPSKVACSAICVAQRVLGKEIWGQEFRSQLGYDVSDFYNCIGFLFRTFQNAPTYPQQAIREKYKSSQYDGVSQIDPPTAW